MSCDDMTSSSSGVVVIQGGTHATTSTLRGIDILLNWVSLDAFHTSNHLYDTPKCHAHTHTAILDTIMHWVAESESARDDFILWLFGPAGSGKSSIANKIAEIAADRDLLIGTFFFSRTSPSRNTKDHLVATLAYQLALSIPDTRTHIEAAIERDPAIFFKKDVQSQIDTLLIEPFQSAQTRIVPCPKLIIIDGLDECSDSQAQVAILEAISRPLTKHNIPIIFLIISRPEPDLITSFNSHSPLSSLHRRLALDDTYLPKHDIHLFFSDKFEHIRRTHPLRSAIPLCWPTPESLETLVDKSAGQFIYATTVVRYVESKHHQPTARLTTILGISPSGTSTPFAELDALYKYILSSVDDTQLTLRVLSLYIVAPRVVQTMGYMKGEDSISPERFLSLGQGDIHRALINLSSIVAYDESSKAVEILHASLVDFLFDKRRSAVFHIDMASTCTDYIHRIFQYVKGPDGIRAGDLSLFNDVIDLCRCCLKSQLRSDILNFDLDTFIKAVVRRYSTVNQIIPTFQWWITILGSMDNDDRDIQQVLDRTTQNFISRLQIYNSNQQLRPLLTWAYHTIQSKIQNDPVPPGTYEPTHLLSSKCTDIDIILGLNEHDHYRIDKDLLDLGHADTLCGWVFPWPMEMMSRYVDGESYASAALHCMHFLNSSPPPEYSESDVEWQGTCGTALYMLCRFLDRANTSAELVQFINSHDIYPIGRGEEEFPNHVWLDMHILAFLSRACSLTEG